MTTLASRVEFGSGGSLVAVDAAQAGRGLRVAAEALNPPASARDGAGAEVLIYGPGRAQRRLTITGSGLAVPVLSGLSLDAGVPCKIYWPDAQTTTINTAVTAGVQGRDTDQHRGLSTWTIVVSGLVTAGVDPLRVT